MLGRRASCSVLCSDFVFLVRFASASRSSFSAVYIFNCSLFIFSFFIVRRLALGIFSFASSVFVVHTTRLIIHTIVLHSPPPPPPPSPSLSWSPVRVRVLALAVVVRIYVYPSPSSFLPFFFFHLFRLYSVLFDSRHSSLAYSFSGRPPFSKPL